jgi:hypothetical protein
MLDDIRNHDTKPTEAEKQWMSVDAVEVVVKSIVLAAIALTIGLSASMLLEPIAAAPAVADAARR